VKRWRADRRILDLILERVPRVFGLCGHRNVGLLEAVYDQPDAIMTHLDPPRAGAHGGCLFPRRAPAGGHAHPACGLGSANMPMALACAYMDSSAFLAITGNVPTSQFNRAATTYGAGVIPDLSNL
jgi:acetolactate synthase-1/2/3 large subunit